MKSVNQFLNSYSIKRMSGSLFVFLFLLTMVGFFGRKESGAEEVINPHNFKQKELCIQCHTNEPPELNSHPVNLCLRCHLDNIGDHIIDIVPVKADVPENVPLTKDGKLACFSCHDYHNKTDNEKMFWVPYNELCVSCHAGY